MNHRTLQTVLRSLAEPGPPATDAALLRQFVSARDEQAFAALVDRHGRLVWAVCRHLTRSDADADDAFQATFLVLMRNAAKIRDAGKLSAWLHGVAYKICAKARQSAKRRTTREQATAINEWTDSAVPGSAWDRALAAVHEEVAGLPEALRVPFVLCCLEGKGVTEAAGQLGWKIGTLSGRLTRAKDALLARLEARGVTLGVAATVTIATTSGVPAAVLAKAVWWVRAGVTVPSSIHQLSQGVFSMSVKQVNLLAAGLLLACGLGLIGGAWWVATADAQSPGGDPPAKGKTADDPKHLIAEYERAKALALLEQALAAAEAAGASTAKWDYDFVRVSDMGTTKFVQFLQDRETRGWEYNGQVTLRHEGKPAEQWVFRRPNARAQSQLEKYERLTRSRPGPEADPKAIEAKIEELQALLAATKAAKTLASRDIGVENEKPQDLAVLFDLLEKSSAKQFGPGKLKVTYDIRGKGSIHLEGRTDAVDWAASVIAKLYGK
ncbi:MAG: sigE 51 [Gemmataceae bacterium]|nr:sigE 51 [Gemmataceae bacterium]